MRFSLLCSLLLLAACGRGQHSEVKDSTTALAPVKRYMNPDVRGLYINRQNFETEVCAIDDQGSVECFGKKPSPMRSSLHLLKRVIKLEQSCVGSERTNPSCWDETRFNFARWKYPDFDGTLMSVNDSAICSLKMNESTIVRCLEKSGLKEYPLSNNESIVDFVRFHKVGGEMLCGLKEDGKGSCRGVNDTSLRQFSSTNRFVQLAAIESDICFLDELGKLSCFNSQNYILKDIPAKVKEAKVMEITGRDKQLCARLEDGSFHCWGEFNYSRADFGTSARTLRVDANRFGLCAAFDDNTIQCNFPGQGGKTRYDRLTGDLIVAAYDKTCALRYSGSSSCWGPGEHWNLPTDMVFDSGRELALGPDFACYTQEGSVACKGESSAFNLANLNQAYNLEVAAAKDQLCALDESGKVRCTGGAAVPADLAPSKRVIAGPDLTCSISTSEDLRCWGGNSLVKKLNDAALKVTELAVGEEHACVIVQDGSQVRCFDEKNHARSDGAVAATKFKEIGVGLNHSCALDSLGYATCWGSLKYGEALAPSATVKHLAVGREHSCIIEANRSIRCWGKPESADTRDWHNTSIQYKKKLYDFAEYLPASRNAVTCEGESCRVPDEPILTFAGANLLYGGGEYYSLWIDYETTCPDMTLVLNGSLAPDTVTTEPGGFQARFYGRTADFIETANASGYISGPAFVTVRNNGTGETRTTFTAPSCDFKISKFAIVPSERTLSGYTTQANSYVQSLEEGISYFKEAKHQIWQFITQTHHDLAKFVDDHFKDVVTHLLNLLLDAKAKGLTGSIAGLNCSSAQQADPARMNSFPCVITRESLMAEISQEKTLQSGTVVFRYHAFKDQMPEWYKEVLQSDDFLDELDVKMSNFTKARSRFSVLKAILENPYIANNGAQDFIAGSLKQILNAPILRSSRFLHVTGALKTKVDELYDNTRKVLDDQIKEMQEPDNNT